MTLNSYYEACAKRKGPGFTKEEFLSRFSLFLGAKNGVWWKPSLRLPAETRLQLFTEMGYSDDEAVDLLLESRLEFQTNEVNGRKFRWVFELCS